MRLIDADALLKTHCNECTLYPNDCLGDGCDNGAAIHIKEAPTVDAVPVVRCKDCKWWKAEKEECYEWYDSPYAPANGYCFRAERKEE